MLFWLLMGAYPAKKTVECLRKPVKGETRHWCFFWFLFTSFRCFDSIISILPFSGLLTTSLLLINYNQHLAELTYRASIGLSNFAYQRIKNHKITSQLNDKAKKFYKKNQKAFTQVTNIVDTLTSTFSSLNASISAATAETFFQNAQKTVTIATGTSLSGLETPSVSSSIFSLSNWLPFITSSKSTITGMGTKVTPTMASSKVAQLTPGIVSLPGMITNQQCIQTKAAKNRSIVATKDEHNDKPKYDAYVLEGSTTSSSSSTSSDLSETSDTNEMNVMNLDDIDF